jgi:Ca2+-binding EF-hand superfamily protein
VFIEPFEICDKDKNWKISTDELGECLEEGELKELGL